MLEHILPFKLVMKEYAARDANYEWLPSDENWIKAEKICKFISVFDTTSKQFQEPNIQQQIFILFKFGV